MDYLSFDLRLGDWNPANQSGIAEVLQSPVGEAERYPFVLPPQLIAHAGRVYRSRTGAMEFGRGLAASVLSSDTLTLWYESYQVARERNRGLRLRLHIDSWDLTRLPWELLYDLKRGDFVVFDPMVSLVRYLRLHAATPILRPRGSLKVLAVVASPKDQPQLDWQRELAVLTEALSELIKGRQVSVLPCLHTTYERLHVALLENTPDVVHFIGHGQYSREAHRGVLSLEDERGRTALLEAPDAARMLQRYGVNLVVLNACETANGAWAGLAPALVRAEIPAVIAMQWPIEDRAAIRFSRLFYKALSLGRTVDECLAEGRIGACAAGADPNDWAAPVLFLRSTSGRLWAEDVAYLRERKSPSPALPVSPARDWPPGSLQGEAEERFHFKTRGPLLPQDGAGIAIDRQELRRALRLAQQPSVTQYIAFLSARQTGKTTLLLRLIELLQGRYVCVFVDLAVLRAENTRACYQFVGARLVAEIGELLDADVALPDPSHVDNSVEFLEFLRELADVVPTGRIIVLLDEVGALAPEVSDSFFNTLRTVFTQGRGLSSQLAKYLFVFSGAVDLYTLTYGANSPLNICEKLYLRDFDRLQVANLVGQFASLGVKVPEGAADMMYNWTGGHPYLTMRLCALLERTDTKVLTAQAIEQAAHQLLIEDDNIRHVIHELERRPAERRRLRGIVMDGKKLPFSRNDPIAASLEMIGVVRASQPCSVRNQLYERALQLYFAQRAEEEPVSLTPSELRGSGDPEDIYSRLLALRSEALDEQGAYKHGRAWETFATALFSLVPAFSVHSGVHTSPEGCDVILAINSAMPGGKHWQAYKPAILVECRDLGDAPRARMMAELLGRARAHRIRLVFAITSGTRIGRGRAVTSGTSDDVTIVFVEDAEIAAALRERRNLEEMLKAKVLQARLHSL